MLLACFILLAAAAAYPVVLYPALVVTLARWKPRPWNEEPLAEPVVHVIAVHNEEQRIEAKLENSLALEPPGGGLCTIVVDDGSTDRTMEIVERFADRGVVRIACPRSGKEQAQLEAVHATREPVLVFSDASTRLEPGSIAELVKPLADPAVSAVSGTDRLDEAETGTGEGLYVRYEMALRRAESLAGSLVGLSGCFFAARREIAERLLPDVPSDMGAALVAIRLGKRAVAQPNARCTYSATPEVEREFARKRRTALRGLRCLWSYSGVLSIRRPRISWQVVSHKWLRFAIPLFALAAMVVVGIAALEGRPWGIALGILLALGLGSGALALRLQLLRRFRPLRALGFLTVSNLAVLAAWSDLLRGHKQVQWVPTRRPGGPR